MEDQETLHDDRAEDRMKKDEVVRGEGIEGLIGQKEGRVAYGERERMNQEQKRKRKKKKVMRKVT